jgi:hypothetical protein
METFGPGGLFDSISSIAKTASRYLPEPFAKGADFASSLTEAAFEMTVDISPEYKALIEKQMEVQAEVQQVTFMSNIERANHESKMAPIRNIRVS